MKSFSFVSVHIAFSFRELAWRNPVLSGISEATPVFTINRLSKYGLHHFSIGHQTGYTRHPSCGPSAEVFTVVSKPPTLICHNTWPGSPQLLSHESV